MTVKCKLHFIRLTETDGYFCEIVSVNINATFILTDKNFIIMLVFSELASGISKFCQCVQNLVWNKNS